MTRVSVRMLDYSETRQAGASHYWVNSGLLQGITGFPDPPSPHPALGPRIAILWGISLGRLWLLAGRILGLSGSWTRTRVPPCPGFRSRYWPRVRATADTG